jgi:hypothetical protein
MSIRQIRALGALVVALGTAGVAHGAACTGVNLGGTYSTADVKYSVNGPDVGPYQDANACHGVAPGNIEAGGGGNNYGPLDLNDWFGGDEFINPGLSAGGSLSATILGNNYTFSLSGPDLIGTSGTYTLSATGQPMPFQLDFALSLKGSNEFAVWFFDDVTFDGSGGGTWAINFNNNGGNNPALSHLNLFIRDGSSSSSSRSSSGGGASSSGEIPEPNSGTMALLGLGLLVGSFAWRRRMRGL